MRHGKKGRKLSRTASHRKATLRNMATSLFRHGRIETTTAKAKELRPFAERLITLARRGDLHARRLAAQKIQDRQAFAAIIPSRMVGGFAFLNTIQSTAQVPHMALSASPRVPGDIQEKIRTALVHAKDTPEGREMLKALFLEAFEPASPGIYDGYAKLLKGVYGY